MIVYPMLYCSLDKFNSLKNFFEFSNVHIRKLIFWGEEDIKISLISKRRVSRISKKFLNSFLEILILLEKPGP